MAGRGGIVLVALATLVLATGAPMASAAGAPVYGVAVVSSSPYVDSFEARHVVGEVVNNTIFPVNFVKVTATFIDVGGHSVGTSSAPTALFALDPGEKSSFDVSNEVPAFATYTLKVTSSIARAPANHNFTVNATSSGVDEVTRRHVTGTITNANLTTAQFVRAEVTFRDAAGRAVEVATAFIDGDEPYSLGAGETASFDAMVFDDVAFATFDVVGDSGTTPTRSVTLVTPPPYPSPLYGTVVPLSGRAGAGAPVAIQRWDRASGWLTLATTTADAQGAYRTAAKILTTWFIRASTPAGSSVPQNVLQRTMVTLKLSATTTRKGSSSTLTGTVRPAYPGRKVEIMQLKPPNWVVIGSATLTSSSTFTYRWTAKARGTFKLRATIADQADSTGGVSPETGIVVR